MPKLTQTIKDGLRLIERSPNQGNEWRQCSPQIYKQITQAIPNDLIEKNEQQKTVRLTQEAKTLLKWM